MHECAAPGFSFINLLLVVPTFLPAGSTGDMTNVEVIA
jgi:hypothetical protein